jgi:hypothetical protein
MPATEATAAKPSPQNRIAELEAALSKKTAECETLRAAYQRLLLDVELLRRRMFIAKAERVDTAQLELEFATKLKALDELSGIDPAQFAAKHAATKRSSRKPTGRRDLRKLPLREVRIELPDPVFEDLVAQGKAVRMSTEESAKLAYERGGMRRLLTVRIKYKHLDPNDGA